MEKMHCVVVDIQHERLDVSAALEFVSDPGFGGIAMFVGRVRDMNHGRRVTGVSYDLFDVLAVNIFNEIALDTLREFDGKLKIFVTHAKGRLSIGDLAVVVAVGSPHRDEAFRACRSIIEKVKHQAPIWKQEHYEDGNSEWSEGCSLCEVHQHAQPNYDLVVGH
ncbi:molybdopterin synthase [Arenimonas maotaiensis]|uniref:Molybdopterin synthase catalytic subunit n=1 Tax=Arenimonas maotaiensis TaxID=1446479 RepID=A0A917FJ24_9GAMM|nr:molybdenum cofactor biosynthesis protein MoaE [Arenimonas maotaiensis]GGF82371.1 molybdopterin synthase [Arenimonas maotaiensis]